MNKASEKTEKCRRIFCKCSRIFGIAMLLLEFAIIAAVLWFAFSLSGGFKGDLKQWDKVREYGPVADQAAWVSEEEDVWLICEKEADDPIAELTVYWITAEGEWLSFEPDFLPRTNVMRFTSADGENDIFDCRYKMKETDQFYLYDFDLCDSEKEVPEFKRLTVTLKKRPYEE